MKHLRRLAFAALLPLAVPYMVQAADTGITESGAPSVAAPVLSAAHKAALREMMAVLDVPSLTRAGMRSVQFPDGPIKEIADVFMRQVTDEDINRRFLGVYASYLDEPTAIELARIFRSSGGRKVLAAAAARHVGKTQLPPQLTAEERRQLAIDEKSPAIRKLNQVQPAINEAMRKEGIAWTNEFMQQVETRALGNVVKGMLQLKNSPSDQPVPEVRFERVGISYMDGMVDVVLRSARKWRVASLNLESELEKSGIATVLEPGNLITKDGVARGIASVDRSELLVEQFMLEINDGLREREEGLRRLDMPAKERFMAGMQAPLGRIYNYFVKLGEAQHRTLDVFRRMLALAESRQGKMEVEDGRLLFANEADLKLFRALADELEQAQHEQQTLASRFEQDERNTMSRMGVSPDTGAALKGK